MRGYASEWFDVYVLDTFRFPRIGLERFKLGKTLGWEEVKR